MVLITKSKNTKSLRGEIDKIIHHSMFFCKECKNTRNVKNGKSRISMWSQRTVSYVGISQPITFDCQQWFSTICGSEVIGYIIVQN